MGRRLSRRQLLAAAGAGAASLAGCTGGGDGGGGGPTETCAESLPRPYLGAADAAVTVAVFEDYACPHCRHFDEQVAPGLVSNYAEPGKIRYEFYDFPIPVRDPTSWQAASAARAVQDREGREAFFAYKSRLFDNQSSLSLDAYASLADGITDGDAVREAARTRCYEPVVTADRQTGRDRGVQGTPTVFVDGEALSAPSYDALRSAVDSALSRNR